MDMTNQKISGKGNVFISDSLNAPCLSFKLYHHEAPTSLEDNKIIVYVARSENESTNQKQVVFELSRPLLFLNQVSDELIIQPEIKNNQVTIKTMIKRKINETGDVLLETEIIEEIDAQIITLFEGTNYIHTNLENVTIEIMYPQDNEFNRNYLNHALYVTTEKNDFPLDAPYYKDVFTKTTDGINLEANNVNINCLTSINNKFHLDQEGNLTVKSITVEDGIGGNINYNEILNLVYPVGAIYMSVMNINPSTLFGGTWEAWATGRTVVGVDETQTEFNAIEKMGGEKTHQLIQDELPNYKMNLLSGAGANYIVKAYAPEQTPVSGNARYYIKYPGVTGSNNGYDITVSSGGKNQPHNNLQPYITCYMWKRIS